MVPGSGFSLRVSSKASSMRFFLQKLQIPRDIHVQGAGGFAEGDKEVFADARGAALAFYVLNIFVAEYRSVVRTGFAEVCPRPQSEESLTVRASSWSVSRSPSVASPSDTLWRMCSIWEVPSRQGVHFPQDSLTTKP